MRQSAPCLAAHVARYQARAHDHGKHIYAFRHIQTNQVLYSLQRTLNGHRSLRQLPDVGANTAQATGTLRRDMWRPLFSVSFPHAPDPLDASSNTQGLDAYMKLLQWRKLHEHYWTPPASLSQPYTEEQLEELKERLRTRGGSKKESVYKMIKRQKKKLRRQEVMDQKANSIADLAAVLIEQEELGGQGGIEKAATRRLRRIREAMEMLDLADEESSGGLQRLSDEREALEPYLERREGWRLEDGAVLSQRAARRQLYELERKEMRMEFAIQSLAVVVREDRRRGLLELLQQQVEGERAALGQDQEAAETKRKLDLILPEARHTLEQDPSLDSMAPLLESVKRKLQLVEDELTTTRQNRLVAYQTASHSASLDNLARRSLGMQSEEQARPATLHELLDTINERLETLRSPASSEEGNAAVPPAAETQAEITRLEATGAEIERLVPFYDLATETMEQPDGVAKIQGWCADLKAQLAVAGVDSITSMDVYQRAEIAAMQDPSGASAGTDNLRQKLEEEHELELQLRDQRLHQNDAETHVARVLEQVRSHGDKGSSNMSVLAVDGEQRISGEVGAEHAQPNISGMQEREEAHVLANQGADGQTAVRTLEAYMLRAWCSMQLWALDRRLKRIRESKAQGSLSPEQQGESRLVQGQIDVLAERMRLPVNAEAQSPEQMKQEVDVEWRKIEDEVSNLEAAIQQSNARGYRARNPGLQSPELTRTRLRRRQLDHRRSLRNKQVRIEIYRKAIAEARGVAEQDVFPDLWPTLTRDASLAAQSGTANSDSTSPGSSPVAATGDAEAASAAATTATRSADTTEQRQTALQGEAYATAPNELYNLFPPFPADPPLPENAFKKSKARKLKRNDRLLHAPVFAMQGVRIKWNNMLDAEFAEAWPEDVQHEPMGLVKYNMPKTEEEALLSMQEVREKELEEKRVRKERRESFVGGVAQAIVTAVQARELSREQALELRTDRKSGKRRVSVRSEA